MELSEFHNLHRNETLWVVAADASLDYFPDAFFERKTVIAVNKPHVPSAYCVSKNDTDDGQTDWVQEHIDAFPQTRFFVSRHCNGDLWRPESDVTGCVVFDHLQNKCAGWHADTDIPDDPNMLLVSYSTLGSALHLAAYMGADTCFVVGASGGSFGDKVYVGDYSQGVTENIVAITSRQTQGICDALHRSYGTQFVTALPWANMRLGGVTFQSEYGRIN